MNLLNRLDLKTDTGVAYDCRLAEISVDYPQAVKEQCRKLQEGKK